MQEAGGGNAGQTLLTLKKNHAKVWLYFNVVFFNYVFKTIIRQQTEAFCSGTFLPLFSCNCTAHHAPAAHTESCYPY